MGLDLFRYNYDRDIHILIAQRKQTLFIGPIIFHYIHRSPPKKERQDFKGDEKLPFWGWHCFTMPPIHKMPQGSPNILNIIFYTRNMMDVKKTQKLQLCKFGRITVILLKTWQSPSCYSAYFLSAHAANSFSSEFWHHVTISKFSFLAIFITNTFPPSSEITHIHFLAGGAWSRRWFEAGEEQLLGVCTADARIFLKTCATALEKPRRLHTAAGEQPGLHISVWRSHPWPYLLICRLWTIPPCSSGWYACVTYLFPIFFSSGRSFYGISLPSCACW